MDASKKCTNNGAGSSATRTSDSSFDFRRSMHCYRNSATSCNKERDTCSLAGSHYGAHIVLSEDSLYCDDIR